MRKRQIYQTQPGDDTTCSNSTCYSQDTLLPCISLEFKGSQAWTQLCQKHHHKAKDALRSTREDNRTCTSIWDRRQNDATYKKSQQDIGWSDAWVRYLDHIAQIDYSHNAPHEQRSINLNLIYLRYVDEDRQATPLSRRPRFEEAKTARTTISDRHPDCCFFF